MDPTNTALVKARDRIWTDILIAMKMKIIIIIITTIIIIKIKIVIKIIISLSWTEFSYHRLIINNKF